jgi:MerR family transcriptional regulator, light-induced transcriptional regulator
MREHLAAGLAAAEAAALASRASVDDRLDRRELDPARARADLADALDRLDEPRAQGILDRLLAAATVDALIRDVVMRYLHELGNRWESGEVSVAQEHFASSVLRGRLLGLARGWGRGFGPLAVLACLPGERHDLGLIAFGLALRSRGWRIAYLGSDTPVETIDEVAGSLEPSLVVLSAVTAERIRPVARQLRALADRHRLGLAGAGAEEGDPEALGALALVDDPTVEAERVTALARTPAPS